MSECARAVARRDSASLTQRASVIYKPITSAQLVAAIVKQFTHGAPAHPGSSTASDQGEMSGPARESLLSEATDSALRKVETPSVVDERDLAPTRGASATASTSRAGAALVVFVEDDPIMQVVAPSLAHALGYRSEVFGDGKAALKRLRDRSAEQPVAVVSDVHMPRMSGPELLAGMRADPVLASIPFALMTASIDMSTTSFDPRPDAVLTKPLKRETLSAALTKIVNASAQSAVPSQGSSDTSSLSVDVADVPPFDAASSAVFGMMDGPDLVAIVAKYASSTSEQLAALEAAFEQRDLATLRELVHLMRGSAMSFAAAPFHDALVALSEAAKVHKWDAALLLSVKKKARRLRKALASACNEQQKAK